MSLSLSCAALTHSLSDLCSALSTSRFTLASARAVVFVCERLTVQFPNRVYRRLQSNRTMFNNILTSYFLFYLVENFIAEPKMATRPNTQVNRINCRLCSRYVVILVVFLFLLHAMLCLVDIDAAGGGD